MTGIKSVFFISETPIIKGEYGKWMSVMGVYECSHYRTGKLKCQRSLLIEVNNVGEKLVSCSLLNALVNFETPW